jgi:hypothetical protein
MRLAGPKIRVAARTQYQADLKLLDNKPKGYRFKFGVREGLLDISDRKWSTPSGAVTIFLSTSH